MAAQNHGVQVVALITTHSHVDPSGGNEEFVSYILLLQTSLHGKPHTLGLVW